MAMRRPSRAGSGRLSSNADLLFYGCNLAAGDDGQDLVNSLTLLTGADVAASDDVTGSAQFGGDWVLEYGKGEIETAVAVSAETQQNWNGVLATFYCHHHDRRCRRASLREAIIEANAQCVQPYAITPGRRHLHLSIGPPRRSCHRGT